MPGRTGRGHCHPAADQGGRQGGGGHRVHSLQHQVPTDAAERDIQHVCREPGNYISYGHPPFYHRYFYDVGLSHLYGLHREVRGHLGRHLCCPGFPGACKYPAAFFPTYRKCRNPISRFWNYPNRVGGGD